MAPTFRRSLGIGLLAALVVIAPAAEARAPSSGGYSRPSMRTPSVAPRAAPAAPRTPSTSGGYSRPGLPPAYDARPRTPPVAPPSASDSDISRRGASDALRNYRAQQERER